MTNKEAISYSGPRESLPARQQGVVLLFIALLILVAASTLLINSLGDTNQLVTMSRSNKLSLNDAKEALIGYAISFPERHSALADAIPGHLPCPDLDGDGVEDGAGCGAAADNAIGFLPWKTLGLAQPKPSQCLWYAVSAGFKSPNSTAAPSILNSDLDGSFQIEDEDGRILGDTTGRNRAIAVVIDAGDPITTGGYSQLRDSNSTRTHCGAVNRANRINQPLNYLDKLGDVHNAYGRKDGAAAGTPGGQNMPSNDPAVIVSGPLNKTDTGIRFNDKVLWINKKHFAPVYTRMNQWVMTKVQTCLKAFGDVNIVAGTRRYPWASPLNSGASPTFNEQAGQRFGRIPDNFLTAGTQWEIDPSSSPTTRCFAWPWWNNWKEQVFFAVSDEHSDTPSTPATNVSINGSAKMFVTLLGGPRINAQSRSNYAEKGQINNYLEGGNIPGPNEGSIPSGNEDFNDGAETAFFNDLICSNTACNFN
ncbi:MAG: hypothetical protein AB8B86_06785 [Pseudomonadales bacterium]